MSNRRRRQRQLTTHKRAWYRTRPRVMAATAADAVKKRLPSRKTTVIVAGVAVVAAATATALTLGLQGPGYHPESFRITYRVEDGTTNPHTITTQILDVRRPLYAALLTRSGPPPGTALTSGSVENRDYIQISSDNGTVKAQTLQPDIATPPGGDLRLEPALGVAAAAGQVTKGKTDKVIGRTCTEYQSHDPLDSGNWKPPAADGDVTSCVDSDGHLLRDAWFIHDKLVRSRTAVSYESNPKPLPDPLAGITVNNSSSPLGVSSAPLSDKVTFTTAIPDPPAGYRRVDSRLVGYTDPQAGTLRSVGRNLLYSNGNDEISVREQRSLTGPVPAPTGPSVDVPGFGTGHWSYTPQGLALTIALDQSSQLRVSGSVTQDALLAFARTIKKAPTPTPSGSP